VCVVSEWSVCVVSQCGLCVVSEWSVSGQCVWSVCVVSLSGPCVVKLLVSVVSIAWYLLVHHELLSNPVATLSVVYRNPVTGVAIAANYRILYSLVASQLGRCTYDQEIVVRLPVGSLSSGYY